MLEPARGYVAEGMPAYVIVQQREFELEGEGYTATGTSARSAPGTSTRSRS
jgi:isocitrate lyase